MRILAATNNRHKLIEFSNILKDVDIEMVVPVDIGGLPEIYESGATFEENAEIKALAAAKLASSRGFVKIPAFADDSGLEVEALNGAPGIYSSRYAEDNDKRIARVLKELENAGQKVLSHKRVSAQHGGGCRLPDSFLNAHFVCVIAIAYQEKVIARFRGEAYGKITFEPKGSKGFGYDPIFIPDGFDKTFAELGLEIKDKISHRAKALEQLKNFLKTKIKECGIDGTL